MNISSTGNSNSANSSGNNNSFDMSALNNQLLELIRQDPSQIEQILKCEYLICLIKLIQSLLDYIVFGYVNI